MDNCQVGVFAAYASENGYAFVDKRLFIPEKWFSDDYAARRRRCKLPEDTVFRTKPQLAAEMLREIDREKPLPFKYVLGDSIYGMSPEFISAVESLPDTTYLVSITKAALCWLKKPMTITRQYQWGGKTKTKTVLADTSSKPVSVEELAKNINNYFWYRRQVSEGTKGPIIYEFTRRKIILSADDTPGKSGMAFNPAHHRGRSAIQLFHQQRILRRSAENACLAQRHVLGHRAVFRGNQDRAGHGPLRGEKVHGLASPHSNVHDGSFFPLAPENQDGKKKRHPLRCPSLGC